MTRSSFAGPSRPPASPAERRLRRLVLTLSARGRHFRAVPSAGGGAPAFRCLAARLVVVLAEPPHAPDPAALRAFLAQGFRVLVVTRHDMLRNFDRVVASVSAAVEEGGEEEHDALR